MRFIKKIFKQKEKTVTKELVINYNTITASLFFEVHESKNLNLLGLEDNEERLLAWELINDKYGSKTNKNHDKVVKLACKIQGLKSKYLVVEQIIFLLKIKRNDKLIEFIHDYGYKLREEEFNEDLKVIETNLNSIEIRIAKFEKELDQLIPKQTNEKEFDFSKNYMAMCLMLETTPKNSNEVLLCDYVSMVEFSEQKVKALNKK